MSEIVEADKLKQIISKIETIESERQESADLLKDTLMRPNLWVLMSRY